MEGAEATAVGGPQRAAAQGPPARGNRAPRRMPRPSQKCCITALTFCLVGAIVLAVPVVVILLPAIRTNFFLAPEEDSSVTSGTPTSRPMRPRPPRPSPAPSTSTTEEAGVHKDCYTPSPNVTVEYDPNGAQQPSQLKPVDGLTTERHPVYCIYNVSRLTGRAGYAFFPWFLPLKLCPAIVYWSWRFPDGIPASRAEEFDRTVGLSSMSTYAEHQKTTVDVFLTLGGFSEDSADFYKIDSDDLMRYRLVQGCYDAYRKYNLSGITLHWVRGTDDCEATYGDGYPRLRKFVGALRRLLSLNFGNKPFNVAAMVDPQLPHDILLFRSIHNQLDIIFFKTHELGPENSTFLEHECKNALPDLRSLLARLAADLPPKPKSLAERSHIRVCMSATLSLYASHGGVRKVPVPPQPASATAGRMALFEVCDSKDSFRNDSSSWNVGCEVRTSLGPTLDVTVAFDNTDTLRRKMDLLGSDRKNTCVLMYDVDFDNFERGCVSTSTETFLLLKNFYKARDPRVNFDLSGRLP